MSRKKKDKIVEIEIAIDVEKKFFKIVDSSYTGSGGFMSGGYKDEENFLEKFCEYFEKYICID